MGPPPRPARPARPARGHLPQEEVVLLAEALHLLPLLLLPEAGELEGRQTGSLRGPGAGAQRVADTPGLTSASRGRVSAEGGGGGGGKAPKHGPWRAGPRSPGPARAAGRAKDQQCPPPGPSKLDPGAERTSWEGGSLEASPQAGPPEAHPFPTWSEPGDQGTQSSQGVSDLGDPRRQVGDVGTEGESHTLLPQWEPRAGAARPSHPGEKFFQFPRFQGTRTNREKDPCMPCLNSQLKCPHAPPRHKAQHGHQVP